MFDCAGRRITVMGLGRFGGGLGVTHWLAAQGAHVLVTDLEDGERLREPLASLRSLIDAGAVSLRLGGHSISDFANSDMVIANPAIPRPWENRFLRAAHAAGIPITTEIELLTERLPCRQRTIGITGSAGKSTTAAMIAHILRERNQDVLLGGNIGGSLLGRLSEINPQTWVVLELSSAMLHWLHGWSPHIAIITSFSENHLDWHGTQRHYLDSKQRILRWQCPGDIAVLQQSAAAWDLADGVHRIVVAPDARIDGLAVPGAHNQHNAAMAVAACTALGIDSLSDPSCRQAATTFPGLPHRLEFIAEAAGARFYNDSKSTTPEATMMALAALGMNAESPRRIQLIAGGYDKGSNLSPIARIAPSLAGLYTIGATGAALASAAGACALHCATLERALDEIFPKLQKGDIVLLSPGCASWDQFVNYEARGNRFADLVRERITQSTRSNTNGQRSHTAPH